MFFNTHFSCSCTFKHYLGSCLTCSSLCRASTPCGTLSRTLIPFSLPSLVALLGLDGSSFTHWFWKKNIYWQAVVVDYCSNLHSFASRFCRLGCVCMGRFWKKINFCCVWKSENSNLPSMPKQCLIVQFCLIRFPMVFMVIRLKNVCCWILWLFDYIFGLPREAAAFVRTPLGFAPFTVDADIRLITFTVEPTMVRRLYLSPQ